MSDANNSIVFTPFEAFAYGTGLGVLTAYPQATGDYWRFLGANGQSKIANSLKGLSSR